METPEDALVAALQGGIELATARIRQAVEEDPERQGMGTTLTALLFARTGSCLALAHVGDSRAYLFREGVLKQVTRDDTFVQMLVDQGVITADQASSHPRRAVVTQALQGERGLPVVRDDGAPGRRPLAAVQRRPLQRGPPGHPHRGARRATRTGTPAPAS